MLFCIKLNISLPVRTQRVNGTWIMQILSLLCSCSQIFCGMQTISVHVRPTCACRMVQSHIYIVACPWRCISSWIKRCIFNWKAKVNIDIVLILVKMVQWLRKWTHNPFRLYIILFTFTFSQSHIAAANVASICIRWVLGSNLDPETVCPVEVFWGFP